jgi:hypothetical protein
VEGQFYYSDVDRDKIMEMRPMKVKEVVHTKEFEEFTLYSERMSEGGTPEK